MARKQSVRRDLQRGNQLHQSGNMSAAIAAYRRHVATHPKDKTAHHNLAVTFEATQQIDSAILSYCRAIEIDPWYPEALNNLGILLHARANFDSARHCFARALAACPEYEDAEYNLATVESSSGNYQQAIVHFSQVLERNPLRATAWNNLGNALVAMRAPVDALEAFQFALALQPDLPDAAWNAAIADLTLGHLPKGWQGFEQRGKLRHTRLPRWDGSEIKDKSILVHAEQGLGDTIQFIRYCGQVKAVTCAQVIVECHPELIPLLQGVNGVDQFTRFSSEVPVEIQYQIPLMSVPLVLGTSLDTIPSVIPYLTVKTALIKEWGKRLAAPEGRLKVGLVWSGNPEHRNDRNRSLDPGHLEALGNLKEIAFYCLQQKPQSAAISGLRSLSFQGVFDELTFPDTAAILFNLDLVISVDTAVAHLAGALGRPVWTLLPYAPDWRWMLDRSDSPWYPTMRLFRQPGLNDWPGVLEQVIAELKALPAAAHQIV